MITVLLSYFGLTSPSTTPTLEQGRNHVKTSLQQKYRGLTLLICEKSERLPSPAAKQINCKQRDWVGDCLLQKSLAAVPIRGLRGNTSCTPARPKYACRQSNQRLISRKGLHAWYKVGSLCASQHCLKWDFVNFQYRVTNVFTEFNRNRFVNKVIIA